MKNLFRFIKENIFWIGIVVGIIVLTIITNMPLIRSIADGSFFSRVIAFVGCLIIFSAFAKLSEGVNKYWKVVFYFVLCVACMVGFVSFIMSI